MEASFSCAQLVGEQRFWERRGLAASLSWRRRRATGYTRGFCFPSVHFFGHAVTDVAVCVDGAGCVGRAVGRETLAAEESIGVLLASCCDPPGQRHLLRLAWSGKRCADCAKQTSVSFSMWQRGSSFQSHHCRTRRHSGVCLQRSLSKLPSGQPQRQRLQGAQLCRAGP